jgi:voltage-gated sodium channel
MFAMFNRCQRLVADSRFQRTVLGLIVINALIMGLETWPAVAARWNQAFSLVNGLIQSLFVAEIAVRVLAHGKRPLEFFRNGWHLFDFCVVALSLLPAAGPLANIARLARVLRVGRLISGVPELRLIIETMLRSIPSMAHIVLLVVLLIYVYGVIGHHLFSKVDPEHWGTLARAAQTLFVVITLEGWVELMAASAEATPWAWLYFVTFIVIAVFVVINLFIAVVLNNLEKVRSEMADPEVKVTALASDAMHELARLHARLDDLHAALASPREPAGCDPAGSRTTSKPPHASGSSTERPLSRELAEDGSGRGGARD